MSRWRTWTWLGALAWMGGAGLARADEVAFTASVNRTEVALNEHLRLTLSISAPDTDLVKDLKLPDTGTLEVSGTSRQESMSFSFSGGTQSFTKIQNIVLVLKPTKTGKTRIGPASMSYGGKKYTTESIRIRVVKARKSQPGQPGRRGRRWPPSLFDDDLLRSPFDDFMDRRVELGENDIFIRAYATPDVVVEGQQITVTVMVYARVGARIASIRWPKLDDFFAVDRDVSKAKTDQKYIEGVLYQFKVLDRKALFPLKPGEFSIGPVEVEVEASVSPFFPAEVRTLRSRPFRVQVEELPAAGRPKGFQGANVGVYELSASVDTNEVALNQPVTYTLSVRGTGNIQRIRPPELPELPRFKRFDPTVVVDVPKHGRNVKGSKTFEYILVPLASGTLSIPALEFSFYDPQAGAYQTLQTEPQTIQVAAGKVAGGAQASASGHQVNIVAPGFDSTIPYGSSLEGYGPPFYRNAFFVPTLVVPPCLYLLVLIIGVVRSRIHADSRRNRMRRAWTRKKKHLKRAGRFVGEGRADAFYAELREALMSGIEARTGLSAQGLTLGELKSRMESVGLSPEAAEAITREAENCDFGRFAPATSRGEEMSAALERVRGVLKTIARAPVRSMREAR